MRCRFTKASRLTNSAEFGKVFTASKAIRSGPLTFLITENTLMRARLGLAVSRKRIRFAVARNRVKRLIRERFRLHAEQLHGYDIVVIPASDAVRASNQQIDSWLKRAFLSLAK